MTHQYDFDAYDPYEEIEGNTRIRNLRRAKQKPARFEPKPERPVPQAFMDLEVIASAENVFNFTYHASRHEHQWILDSLGPFYEEHWISDILSLVRGGKEATVYLAQAHPSTEVDLIAAKVYRPRVNRNMRDDHIYKEGRILLDSSGRRVKDDRAMRAAEDKKSRFGWSVVHTSWIEYEFQTLVDLYDAGADVPKPFARGHNAILMEYIGEVANPAPTLNNVDLSVSEARLLYEGVIHNVELFLQHNRVHGDLSAYNILYWEGAIKFIDFPQVIDTERNTSAYQIFQRDLARVCQYFRRYGIHTDAPRLARRMWEGLKHRTSPLLDAAYLDVDDPDDRKHWAVQQRQLKKEGAPR